MPKPTKILLLPLFIFLILFSQGCFPITFIENLIHEIKFINEITPDYIEQLERLKEIRKDYITLLGELDELYESHKEKLPPALKEEYLELTRELKKGIEQQEKAIAERQKVRPQIFRRDWLMLVLEWGTFVPDFGYSLGAGNEYKNRLNKFIQQQEPPAAE